MTRIVSNALRPGGRRPLQTSGTPGLGRATLPRATLDVTKALAPPPHPKDYKSGAGPGASAGSPEATALQGLAHPIRPFK